jgi:hypothetical protein
MSVGDGWTRVSPLPVWASLIYHLAEAPPWCPSWAPLRRRSSLAHARSWHVVAAEDQGRRGTSRSGHPCGGLRRNPRWQGSAKLLKPEALAGRFREIHTSPPQTASRQPGVRAANPMSGGASEFPRISALTWPPCSARPRSSPLPRDIARQRSLGVHADARDPREPVYTCLSRSQESRTRSDAGSSHRRSWPDRYCHHTAM